MALTQQPQWVAAYTSPRAEKIVTERIANELQLESYLPLHRVLRRWYERFGAVHTGTEKFDFFPFTCGYMEIRL